MIEETFSNKDRYKRAAAATATLHYPSQTILAVESAITEECDRRVMNVSIHLIKGRFMGRIRDSGHLIDTSREDNNSDGRRRRGSSVRGWEVAVSTDVSRLIC